MKHFHDYLVVYSQLNGSFYKRLPIVASAAGLRWDWVAEMDANPLYAPKKQQVGRG